MNIPMNVPIWALSRSAYLPSSLLALAAFASLTSLPAQAAQAIGDPPAQQRRLVLEVDMTRQGRVSNGVESGLEQRRQRWRVALVFSGGERTTANPFDAHSNDAALAQAQRAPGQGWASQPSSWRCGNSRPPAAAALRGKDSACMAREGLKAHGPGRAASHGPGDRG